jgi:hypothetical protein
MAKTKASRPPIDESEFVKVWARVHKSGGGLQEVADEIGCSYAGAKNKAEKLEEAGLKLPALKKGRSAKKIDVDGLQAIFKEEMSRRG